MDQVIEEIKSIFTEKEFNSRLEIIEGYHAAGKLIPTIEGITLHDLAEKVGRSERTLHYAVAFYKAFPDLTKLIEGKNISMNMIIKKYLTAPKDEAEHVHSPITICKSCRKVLPIDNG